MKAVEYYLKRRLVEDLGWPPERTELVHFAATSEDVNNLAYARMVRAALAEAWLPAAAALVEAVRAAALEYAGLTDARAARTASQPRLRRLAKSWLFSSRAGNVSCERSARSRSPGSGGALPGRWPPM